MRERVCAARAIQSRRFEGTDIACNAQMTASMIGQFCRLSGAGDALMRSAFERMGLTARSHDRILRVARTIADLDGEADILPQHWRRPSSSGIRTSCVDKKETAHAVSFSAFS